MSDQRIAVVTGSHRGLGLAIAKGLARKGGVRVIITSRKQEEGREAQRKLAAEGVEVSHFTLDVDDATSVERFGQALKNEFGRVDILVNNAGINPSMQASEQSLLTARAEDAMNSFSVNALAALRVTQAVAPLMKAKGYGRIVNVSTEMASIELMADDRYPLGPSYRISKAALNAITRLLAKELKGSGILVNAYSPGWMRTDMGGPSAPFSADEGAEVAVHLASLPDDGPSGGFFAEMRRLGGPIALPF